MKKVLFALPRILLFLLLLFGCNQPQEVVEEIEIEKTIDPAMQPGMMHIVHFWLTEGLTEAETADFVKGVKSLEAVPTVQRLFVGKPATTPSRGVVDNSFDYALIVHFANVEDHNVYQDHPVHLKFVEDHQAKFGRVTVQDNFLE